MGKYFFKSRAPFLQCPKCNSRAFGVLNVGGVHYVRRCNDCDFSQTFKLPKPIKKLVYIDQYAISFDVKAKVGRAHKKWPDVKRALEQALYMEAIACPYSEYHEGESSVEKNFAKELKNTYKRFARGEAFQPRVYIELAQIARALRRFVKEPEKASCPTWSDVLHNDPHVWTGDIYITLNTEQARAVEATARQVKAQISAKLDDLNKDFKESKKSFEEQHLLEAQQVGVNMLKIYTKEIARLMTCKSSAEMIAVKMDGSVFFDQAEYILKFFGGRGADFTEKWKNTVGFLKSRDFFDVDYVRINSALWAGLARRVGLGQAKVAVSDYNDVPIISTYAPYCDVMLIDDGMRSLLTTNPVKDCLKLRTKFFSPNCFDEFIAYLEGVISELPQDVKKAVLEIHGEFPEAGKGNRAKNFWRFLRKWCCATLQRIRVDGRGR